MIIEDLAPGQEVLTQDYLSGLWKSQQLYSPRGKTADHTGSETAKDALSLGAEED